MMLKTILFLFLGSSFYFGQSIKNPGSFSGQSNSACTDCTLNLAVSSEGDGTKATGTSGQGSGTTSDDVELLIRQTKNSLIIQLMPQNRNLRAFTIYDSAWNIKKAQQISPTNSYTIDTSDLLSGNYTIELEIVSPNVSMQQSFTKE